MVCVGGNGFAHNDLVFDLFPSGSTASSSFRRLQFQVITSFETDEPHQNFGMDRTRSPSVDNILEVLEVRNHSTRQKKNAMVDNVDWYYHWPG